MKLLDFDSFVSIVRRGYESGDTYKTFSFDTMSIFPL